jgi:hypothetical protein
MINIKYIIYRDAIIIYKNKSMIKFEYELRLYYTVMMMYVYDMMMRRFGFKFIFYPAKYFIVDKKENRLYFIV